MSLTNFAETTLVNAMLRGGAFTPPTQLFVALHKSDPTETGAVGEASGGGYARQLVTFAAPSDGQSANSVVINFTITGLNLGSITHVSVWDALSGGNAWVYDPLDVSTLFQDGDVLQFVVGALVVTIA